jgi:hypothetical protein
VPQAFLLELVSGERSNRKLQPGAPGAFLLELVVGEYSDRNLHLNQWTEADNSTRGGLPTLGIGLDTDPPVAPPQLSFPLALRAIPGFRSQL